MSALPVSTDDPGSLPPAWQIQEWLNTQEPLQLEALRGKVVLAVAFQMLCPGCVSHALPQAMRVRRLFSEKDAAVVGIHTVFEHHEAQGSRAALAAFLHEYGITFPVGIDAGAAAGRLPQTMQLYQMRGTPTTLLYDRAGKLRMSTFGHVEDMALGAAMASLVGEAGADDAAADEDTRAD